MIGCILTGHGSFADGLGGALEMVGGPQQCFETVTFYEDEAAEFPQKIADAIAIARQRLRFQHRGCIFHCFFRCRFRSSRGRPDLQGGHRQLCGSCFPQPDRGICGEPSG